MFTAAFTASQSATGDQLVITDDSVYTSENKSTFSDRVLKLYMNDGTLYPGGTEIPFGFAEYPDDTITIDDIPKDYAFDIRLELTSNSPQGGSTYTLSVKSLLQNFLRQFLYGKCQEISANPTLTSRPNFYNSLQIVHTELSNAINAIGYSDVSSAQSALDRANNIIQNENLYF